MSLVRNNAGSKRPKSSDFINLATLTYDDENKTIRTKHRDILHYVTVNKFPRFVLRSSSSRRYSVFVTNQRAKFYSTFGLLEPALLLFGSCVPRIGANRSLLYRLFSVRQRYIDQIR